MEHDNFFILRFLFSLSISFLCVLALLSLPFDKHIVDALQIPVLHILNEILPVHEGHAEPEAGPDGL